MGSSEDRPFQSMMAADRSISASDDRCPVLLIDLAKRYGGAEVRVLDTARGLHDAGIPYSVAVLAQRPLHRALLDRGLAATPLSYRRSDPRLFLALWRLMVREGYKVIDAHNVQSQFWGVPAARIAGVRRVLSTVHSSYRETETGLKAFFYEQALRLCRLRSTRFIAVSEAVRNYLRGIGIPQDGIDLIPNSVSIPKVDEEKRVPLRKTFGWTEDHFVVAFVGRLEPVKGLPYLLEAVQKKMATHPGLRLLLVGEGRSRPLLEARVKELGLEGAVTFTGFRSDVPTLLTACDLFCLPSLSEGLPYTLLEACACRRPIVATAVGGMEHFLTDGDNAFLVPPRSPRALADAIGALMEDRKLATDLGAGAFRLLQEHQSPERMIARTLNLYHPEK